MRLKGEDISDAYRDWVRTDIKEAGKTGYDTGKFLFGVSSWSIGGLATLAKLDTSYAFKTWDLVPFGLLFVSTLISLLLVLPRILLVDGNTDLSTLHKSAVSFCYRRVVLWFVIWILGIVSALGILFQ